MKQKWPELSIGQKVIFCIQIVLIVLFLILYSTVGNQKILRYQNASLRCTVDGETVTYSGRVNGDATSFSITGTTVEYRRGARAITYTVTEDPSAIPAKESMDLDSDILYQKMSGVEVRKDGEVLFRGGWVPFSSTLVLYNEDGSTTFPGSTIIYSSTGAGLEDPGASTILRILYQPSVIQRANFLGLFCGILLCIVNMVSLLYADSIFRWNLRFRIRNAEDAEPSEWELFSRWIAWFGCTVLAVVCFILGLTGM